MSLVCRSFDFVLSATKKHLILNNAKFGVVHHFNYTLLLDTVDKVSNCICFLSATDN